MKEREMRRNEMTDIVIVPGGWRGGWTFSSIAREIRARGHEAWTPTLTGLGERVHLASGAVNLDTHIDDIANVLLYEELTDVTLCGHSYAGMVITGVADRMPERIAKLVYVDAFLPEDGDSWWDLAGDYYRQFAIERPSADGRGVMPPENRDTRCVPHPLAAFRQSIRLSGRWREVREKVFVYATGWSETPFTATYERLKNDTTWRVISLPTGHSVIREAPEEFLSIVTA
jgi:pimeloyl-ACP methyl ester carboxylesterase